MPKLKGGLDPSSVMSTENMQRNARNYFQSREDIERQIKAGPLRDYSIYTKAMLQLAAMNERADLNVAIHAGDRETSRNLFANAADGVKWAAKFDRIMLQEKKRKSENRSDRDR
jgi:hypothetical protein